jgi:dTDP-4-dehydrorhamnose 3,5-epimerase
MLPGVEVKSLKRLADERGLFSEVYRKDWPIFGSGLESDSDSVLQANLSVSFPGTIRAWHRHLRGQVDFFVCLKGAIKIGIYDDKSCELDEIVSSALSLQIVRVPGKFWHGFKVLGDEQVMLLYFTTKLYDASDPDEERRVWNDALIVPKSINGNMADFRVGKVWDWNALAHK